MGWWVAEGPSKVRLWSTFWCQSTWKRGAVWGVMWLWDAFRAAGNRNRGAWYSCRSLVSQMCRRVWVEGVPPKAF